MRRSVNAIKQLLDECSDQDRDEWKSHAQTILGAIRASDPTRGGVKGAIAAAFFVDGVMPRVVELGWKRTSEVPREAPFGIAIEKNGLVVRIVIAILQLDAGKPKRQHPRDGQGDRYIVQVQKKLSRNHAVNGGGNAGRHELVEPKVLQARAYSFGDFDVLAVNMHPVTRRWTEFRYTWSTRLSASKDHPLLIATSQLVSLESSSQWTNDFAKCLDWLFEQTTGTAFQTTSAANTS